MSGTGSLLDAVQLADTLGTAGVRSPQVSVLWGTVKHIRQGSRAISLLHSSGRSKVPSDVQQAVSRSGMSVRKLSLYTPAGRKAAGEGEGDWARSIRREFPIQIKAPIKKILRRLRDRGIISRRRPWPIHVACLSTMFWITFEIELSRSHIASISMIHVTLVETSRGQNRAQGTLVCFNRDF